MDRGAWWATSWGHRESDTTERLTYTHGDKSGKNGEIKKKKIIGRILVLIMVVYAKEVRRQGHS